jgi:hypothetical protein
VLVLSVDLMRTGSGMRPIVALALALIANKLLNKITSYLMLCFLARVLLFYVCSHNFIFNAGKSPHT